MHQTLLTFIVGLAFGIEVALTSSVSTEIAVFFFFLFVAQGIVYFYTKKKSHVARFMMAFLIASVIGIVRVQFVTTSEPYFCDKSCSFEGTVTEMPEVKGTYQSLVVSESDNHSRIIIRAPLYPTYEMGDVLLLTGKVTAPEQSYPHQGGSTFDYVSYLLGKNIGSEMYYPKIEVTGRAPETLTQKLTRLRFELTKRLSMYVKSPSDTLASGMLFGNQTMSPELLATFRTAGLSHIIVLSGFNIAILITSILFLFAFLPLLFRVVLTVICVTLFVMMVGGTPSVIRATLMALISLLALVSGREYVARQALLLSLVVVTLYSPVSLVNDVSLHLSFLATAGIIYLLPMLEERFDMIRPGTFKDIILTTISAYLSTLPYIMYTFGTLSVYAILSNLLVLPFVSLIMLMSFITVVSSFVLVLPHVTGYVTYLLSSFVIFIAQLIEGLPYSQVTVHIGVLTMVFLYILIIGGVAYVCFHRKNETYVTKDGGIISGVMSY